MSIRLGPITIGSPAAERQASEALASQRQLAQQLGSMTTEYLNPTVDRYYRNAMETPQWLGQIRSQQADDVTRGLRSAFGDLRSGYTSRGMYDSGASRDALAMLARAGGASLARIAPQTAQMADTRQANYLQSLIAALTGMNQGAMSGYGAVGQGYQEQADAAMQPFYAALQFLAQQAGRIAGEASGSSAAPWASGTTFGAG